MLIKIIFDNVNPRMVCKKFDMTLFNGYELMDKQIA